MRQLIIALLVALSACEGPQGDQPMNETRGFFSLPADKLGTTAIVAPNAATGARGDLVKMLDLSIPDSEAQSVIISIRSEYSTNQATVSQTITGPFHVIAATNAAPIAITTLEAHGLVTGQNVTIQGCMGNVQANITTTVTVTGPNTFTLNGSDGTLSPAYTGGGTVLASSTGGTGSGAANVGSPLVGILQWGVGGGQNQVEFDIPNPKLVQLLYPTAFPQSQPMSNTGMGVQVGVSASHISLYARNDSNLAPLASAGANTPIGNNILPAKVIVFVSPGEIDSDSRLERTIYVAEGIASLAAGAFVVMSVPPFAQRLRIQRAPAGTPIGLTFSNNVGNPYRNVDLGPNDEGDIPLDPNCQTIVINNTGAAAIPRLQAVFNVKP